MRGGGGDSPDFYKLKNERFLISESPFNFAENEEKEVFRRLKKNIHRLTRLDNAFFPATIFIISTTFSLA